MEVAGDRSPAVAAVAYALEVATAMRKTLGDARLDIRHNDPLCEKVRQMQDWIDRADAEGEDAGEASFSHILECVNILIHEMDALKASAQFPPFVLEYLKGPKAAAMSSASSSTCPLPRGSAAKEEPEVVAAVKEEPDGRTLSGKAAEPSELVHAKEEFTQGNLHVEAESAGSSKIVSITKEPIKNESAESSELVRVKEESIQEDLHVEDDSAESSKIVGLTQQPVKEEFAESSQLIGVEEGSTQEDLHVEDDRDESSKMVRVTKQPLKEESAESSEADEVTEEPRQEGPEVKDDEPIQEKSMKKEPVNKDTASKKRRKRKRRPGYEKDKRQRRRDNMLRKELTAAAELHAFKELLESMTW